MKRLPHLLALFLFGLVLGLPFGIYVLRHGFLEKEKTMGMLGEQNMADDFAKNQFTHADPQSAREALKYAIKTHEQMRASNSKYWGNPQQIDLGWCYAELSVVEESAGNATLAKKYIEESNRLFKQLDVKDSTLVRLMETLHATQAKVDSSSPADGALR